MSENHKKFEIFVNGTKFEVSIDDLTGTQIKELAGIPITDLLEEKEKNIWLTINDDQEVEIKSGVHFRTHPGGQDS